ncbi:MAG: hypothetical protein ACOC84_02280 [Actinomycetota bacterium]
MRVRPLTRERRYLDGIDEAVILVERTEDYRVEDNRGRPREASAWTIVP